MGRRIISLILFFAAPVKTSGASLVGPVIQIEVLGPFHEPSPQKWAGHESGLGGLEGGWESEDGDHGLLMCWVELESGIWFVVGWFARRLLWEDGRVVVMLHIILYSLDPCDVIAFCTNRVLLLWKSSFVVHSQNFLISNAQSRKTPFYAKASCRTIHDLAAPFLCLTLSDFAVAVESTPCAALAVSLSSCFNSLSSFSRSSVSSSLGSYSLRSSSAVLYKTNRTAILQMRKNQKRLTACRLARRPKVMYCAIQHLYC